MTAAVFLGWFAALVRALVPTVGGEDAGEFATAAAGLGVGHAPGYPLHALAGRLAMLVPAGDPAFRLNLLSAASAAGAAAAVFALVRNAAGRPGAAGMAGGLAASAVFLLAPAAWHQATISDKYAFHLLMHALIATSLLRGVRWPALALLAGLGLAHHLQTLYLLPAIGWASLRVRRPSSRTGGLAVAAVAIGLSLKGLYPPIRASADPILLLAKPDTMARHARYLAAGSYSSRIAGPAAARWKDAGTRMWHEAAGAGLATGVLGWLGATAIRTVAGLTAVTGFVLAASLDITGREFYLLPIVWWLAAGTGLLAARGLGAPGRWIRSAGLAAVAVPLLLASLHRDWYPRSRLTVERDHARHLLAGLPRGALLLASGDDVLYPLFYLRAVLDERPDVALVPEGFLGWPPARARVARFLPETGRLLAAPAIVNSEDGWTRAVAATCLAAGRPVVITNPSRGKAVAGLALEVRDAGWAVRVPDGTGVLAARPPRDVPLRTWWTPPGRLTDRQAWQIGLAGRYLRQRADALANEGRPAASLARFRLAIANPFAGDRAGALNNYGLALERTGDRDAALRAYRRAAALPDARAEVWLNGGNLALALGRRDEARRWFEVALARSEPGSSHAAYARRHLDRPGGAGAGQGAGR